MPETVVVELDRQHRVVDIHGTVDGVDVVHEIDARHVLLHATEDDAAGLVALQGDGNGAGPSLEGDDAELQRRAEHEGRTEHRVPGKGHFQAWVEDAQAHVTVRLGRQHEGDLRKPDLQRQRLHHLCLEPARIGEDRELVAL